MAVYEQLGQLRQALGLSMAEMASILGMGRASSYQYYEDPKGYKGLEVPDVIAEKLMTAAMQGQIKMSAEELQQHFPRIQFAEYDKRGTPFAAVQHQLNDHYKIPLYKGRDLPLLISGKAGGFDGWTWIHRRLIQQIRVQTEELCIIEISRELAVDNFSEGDWLMIDRSVRNLQSVGIYLLLLNGQLYIRRMAELFSDGRAVIFQPDGEIEDFTGDPGGAEILGKAVWTCRSLTSFSGLLSGAPIRPRDP